MCNVSPNIKKQLLANNITQSFYLRPMAIKLKHSDTFSTYFVTFTCINWLPLFEIVQAYDLVYKWFGTLKETYNADVVAYVIMPNHLHVILHFQATGFNLNSIIANGKRFMAYEIINRLERLADKTTLTKLANMVTLREKKRGQLHKVFKDSFDAKPIMTHAFLLQKLNYIHYNPVSGKWMLAKDYLAYEHSSASFYELHTWLHFKPLNYMDI